jgi:hypothetical protein
MSTSYDEALQALQEAATSGDVDAAYTGTNNAATVRVRKAFQTAKDALHEAKKEVQAIKKGDQIGLDVRQYFGE